jgi:hypothetical protein
MRCLLAVLTLVLGILPLAAQPASAAVAVHLENRASGSAAVADTLGSQNTRLSDEAVRENITLRYDLASDSPVAAEGAVAEGTTLFRVFGGEARGLGQSWTTVNPGEVANFREAAGLFPGNTGQFVIEGQLSSTEGVLFRGALPGPGGIGGGLPEVIVPNAGGQICILCVSGVNPPF